MYDVITASGSTYTIRNGRITRDGDVNPYLPPDAQVGAMVNLCFTWVTPPVLGAPMVFRTADGRITRTSPVEAILPSIIHGYLVFNGPDFDLMAELALDA